eukprot:6244482-Ditylum_brightwellii.AAC.1
MRSLVSLETEKKRGKYVIPATPRSAIFTGYISIDAMFFPNVPQGSPYSMLALLCLSSAYVTWRWGDLRCLSDSLCLS